MPIREGESTGSPGQTTLVDGETHQITLQKKDVNEFVHVADITTHKAQKMFSIENRRELEDGMAVKIENINKAMEANTGQQKDGASTQEGRETEQGTVEKDGAKKEEGRGTEEGTVEKDGAKKEEGRATEEGTEEKEAPPVTAKDIQADKDEAMAKMEADVVTIQEIPLLDEEGNVDVKVRNCILRMSTSYFAAKKAPLEEVIEFRKELSKVMVESGSLSAVCNIVIQIYPHGWANEENTTNASRWNPLKNSMLLLLNYSDASELLAVHIANVDGFLEMIKQIIVDSTVPHLSDKEPVNRAKLTKWCLSMIHNISMVETNIGHLRRLDFVEILKPYLASPVEMIRFTVMASLAGIINEEESEIINTNKDHVRLLMDVLRKSLTDPKRRNRGWSCKECGLTIRQLARNDANKKLLVDLEALKLLVELAETGNDDEKAEAVQAIWALTFDEDNRKHIINDDDLGRGVVNILRSSKTSDDRRISKACHGALWTLREDLATSPNQDYKETGERLLEKKSDGDMRRRAKKKKTEKPSATDDNVQHVMISYQWSDQDILKKIRDELKNHGMKVWMDIDQMGGSTLQAMADAVESAGAVLMCMSQKYKNSPNCRAEAEYSFQQRKKIVPLMMERGYKPDGWLGFIAGAKLFFDFSGKYPFEPKRDGLLKELRRVTQPNDQHKEETITPVRVEQSHALPPLDTSDGPPPVSHPVTMGTSGRHMLDKSLINTIRKWTPEQVVNWVNKNNLPHSKFANITSGEIALLVKMKSEAPEFFYKALQDMLKCKDLLTMSQIVWALEDIGET